MPLFRPNRRRQNTLRTTTIREFKGGWNVIDQDLNLSSNFAKRLVNMEREPDGSIGVREGTYLFVDTASVIGSDIVNGRYFADHIICVHDDGRISATDASGNVREIWSDEIAGLLPFSPSGWNNISFVSFAEFRNQLIICSGTDKPVLVSSNLSVDYLQDLATLTNVNTPVARYVFVHKKFVVMTGDLTDLGIAHISNEDTSGTWQGDPAPNNGTQIRVDTSVPAGSSEVRGAVSFADRAVFAFDDALVPVELGVFNDSADHVPSFGDSVDQYGAISHRSILSLGDDVLFCDVSGIPSLKRAILTETLRPERVSQLIDPEIQKDLQPLSLRALEDHVFAVYHRLQGHYMLFVPNASNKADKSETRGFQYTSIPALKVRSWSELRQWNWDWGARSQQGTVFLGRDTRIYVLGQKYGLNADYIDEQEAFDDDTDFTDHTGFTPIVDGPSSGLPIDFEWELPWADFDKRLEVKKSRVIGIDAVGSARFTVDMFVDNILEDRNDPGQTFTDKTLFDDGTGFEYGYLERKLVPHLSTVFVAGDVGGFGVSQFGSSPFGGGRDTSNLLLYAWPAKFKIAKFRISGSSRFPLNVIALSLAYQDGSIYL